MDHFDILDFEKICFIYFSWQVPLRLKLCFVKNNSIDNGFCDIGFFLLEIIVSINLIDRIFCNFDR